ncbi:MAG: hypothetical protein WBG93_00260, partial [Thermoanaerobaculia bacterium]
MQDLRRPSDLTIYIAVSVGLVLNTALLPLFPDLGVWKLNLGAELNPAVWWSAIGLLMASLLSWQRSSTATGERLAWLGLAGVWFAFYADELASIHERIGYWQGWGWRGLLGFGVVFGLVLVYSIARLMKREGTRRSAWLIAWAVVLFASVALQEQIEHVIAWPASLRGPRVGLEEGIELLAIVLLLIAAMGPRERSGDDSSSRTPVADPVRLPGFPTLMLAAALTHLALVGPVGWFGDERGEPLIVFPVFAYFVLFAMAYHQALEEHGRDRWSWMGLAILGLIGSVVSGTNPDHFPGPLADMARTVQSNGIASVAVQGGLVVALLSGRLRAISGSALAARVGQALV